jgi:hypothetical protein
MFIEEAVREGTSLVIEGKQFSIEGYHFEYGSIYNFSRKEEMEDITIHLLFSSWVISSRFISLEKFNDSTRALVFVDVVITELLSQLSSLELSLPILLKLKSITSISCSSSATVTQVLHGFRQVISGFFFQASVKVKGKVRNPWNL